MAKKPVIVYGASGYTGRLVCEYLRELGLPFVAAGRDKARVQAVLDKVPGIETADYEVAEVPHEVGALTEFFRGSKIVSNMVGPFSKYGPEVAEACLAAGCHYTDTTGEQDWVLDAKTRFGAKFAERGLLIAPGVAQMYTTGEIAANICLETPGLDTLDILVLWKGFPTYASTQTIFSILQAKWYYLERNAFVEWAQNTHYEVNVPGQHAHALVTPWAGTSHPVWFKDDPRVANCKALGGVFAREVMEGFVATQKMFEEQIKPLPPDQQQAALANIAASIQAGMPPRENPRVNISLDFGLRLGAARPRPLRHPRQLQLQADRPPAGLRRGLSSSGAAAQDRVRFGLPGFRASRPAGRAEEPRPRHESRPHRPRLTPASGSEPVSHPRTLAGASAHAAARRSRQGRIARRRRVLLQTRLTISPRHFAKAVSGLP